MPEPGNLSLLTSQKAVLRAIKEYDERGANAFLSAYGFGRARSYFLVHGGKRYDSKAIAGVALGLQLARKPRNDFSGGEQTVWRALTRLGFTVEGARALAVDPDLRKPTADEEELSRRAEGLRMAARKAKAPLPRPKGQQTPASVEGNRRAFLRDPQVRAFVLDRANGHCELCNASPFVNDDGAPYLEVHHLHRLADGGSDTVENAAALCAGCHRELHFGKARRRRLAELRRRLPALA